MVQPVSTINSTLPASHLECPKFHPEHIFFNIYNNAFLVNISIGKWLVCVVLAPTRFTKSKRTLLD